MSNEESKPNLFWWITIAMAAGCLVLMLAFTARSISNALRKPVLSPPPVVAPAITPLEVHSEPAPTSPEAAAVPRLPKSHNIMPNFEQRVQAEQDRKRSYELLREQAKVHPGQLGTLTEKEIRKLEKEGETGDSGFP
ncbi:MAG: hypothetical protein NT011_08510 [Kiritimatiellaeota bacterium]|nr:hypothetical protein [Kiritimatiellota bacterium]